MSSFKQLRPDFLLQYDDGYSFSDGLARVRKGNSVLYIDKNGKTQISKKLKNDDSDYLDFSENLASFYSNGKFGFINKKGKCVFVLGSNITYADDFYDGRCLVYNQKGKVGYINKKGKVVIPTKYDDGSVFQEGMAYVKIKNKYGYINASGKVVVKATYDRADVFQNGLAYVEKNGKAYYINKKGKTVIKLP